MQSHVNLLPARGDNAVEILLNDHQVIKTLLTNLTQAERDTARKEALEQLKAALTIHNATEENLVYPALALVADEKHQAEHLYHETAAADMLLFQLDTMLKEGETSKFDKTAEALQAAILEHVDDEENKAFPKLQKKAEPQQSALLAESVKQFRAAMSFTPA
jgi:hemerythrin superfamily protein